MRRDHRELTTAGMLLGVGLGGFVDGIVFHQLLQLHGMLSGRIPKTTVANLEINMFWDGVFHAFTWLTTAAGVWLLFRAAQRRRAMPMRVFVGSGAFGWGLFNVVEGLIDHHLLGLHHVVERLGVSPFDYAFLASGLVLMALGALAMRGPADMPAAPGVQASSGFTNPG